MDFDVLVIGAGPGGYHAAIRAAQLGLKVACAEMGAVGGVCLNIGCIPTKALLHAGETIANTRHAQDFGLSYGTPTLDIAKMNGWKDGIVKKLTGGVAGLFRANKVTHLVGQASFIDAQTVQIGDKSYTASNFIIATGSQPAALRGLEVDQERIVDSTGALNVPDPVPARMLCIGGGVIGFEFAHIYNNLGSQVKIIEYLPNIIPGADADAVKEFGKIMAKQGIQIVTRTKANSAVQKEDGVHVELESVESGEKTVEVFDRVLVAVGRRPRTDGLKLEAAGLKASERGFIEVNTKQQTAVPHIYAVGDVAGNPMLAHKAMKEGLVAAEVIAGKPSEQDAVAIPGVVYTSPELRLGGPDRAGSAGQGLQGQDRPVSHERFWPRHDPAEHRRLREDGGGRGQRPAAGRAYRGGARLGPAGRGRAGAGDGRHRLRRGPDHPRPPHPGRERAGGRRSGPQAGHPHRQPISGGMQQKRRRPWRRPPL